MPGNSTIQQHIEKLLTNQKQHCILYIDLDNFKTYNDKYGFAKGDEVILATAKLSEQIAEKMKLSNFFCGHIGGDDFVITTEQQDAHGYIKNFMDAFDNMIKSFYQEKDLKQGYINSVNRKNEVAKAPLLSVSIASVDLSKRKYENYLEINYTCVELKNEAKKIEGNCFLFDRRSTTPACPV